MTRSTVVPLMVLQVPNTPDPDDIGRALDTIYQAMAGIAQRKRGACIW